ncbi:hypothetical protein D9M71_725440 [compost metagenome]
MRHHRGPENPDGQVQRRSIADGGQRRRESPCDVWPVRLDQQQLNEETHTDGAHQHQHDRFQAAEAPILQGQHQQRVERREGDVEGQRATQQQMECQRTAEYFGKVGGDDRDFRQ